MSEGKKKLLIIEDDHSLSQILKQSFEEQGFDVSQAYDGKQGLSVALSSHPDVILLDIIMPEMDGLLMLKSLRADEWGKNVPVIMLTNLNDTQRALEAVQYNVKDYLVKAECTIEHIAGKIKEKLGIAS